MPAFPTTIARRAQRLARTLPLLFLAGCAWLVGARPLRDIRPGGTIWAHMAFGGRTRSFVLHLPPAASRGPVPLLLAFHGYRGSGAVLRESSGMDAQADRHGIAVAYLDGTGPLNVMGLAWNAGTCCGRAQADDVDDVGFAAAVVDRLAERGLVDRGRVWAAGFSNGGMLALKLACERADLVRGAVDVAGSMPDMPCDPSRHVKVMLIEGSDDDELRHDLRTLRRQVRYFPFAASFASAFRFWRDHAGCTGPTLVTAAPKTIVRTATECAPDGGAALVTVRGHPHAWPGGGRTWPLAPEPAPQWDASARLLDFLLGD